jgi:hypothetical protein
MRGAVAILVALVASHAFGDAEARKVFLNGVEVGDLREQSFETCSVRFDAQGNVHITAHGYKVEAQVAQPAPPPAPRFQKKYFLYVERTGPLGLSQYDVDVFLNQRFVKRFRADGNDNLLELTTQLVPGSNLVQLVARKNLEGGRRSADPSHAIRVTLGEGSLAGQSVMIEQKLFEFSASAAEVEPEKQGYQRFVPR